MNLIIEGTIESLTTRQDKTVRINVGTQEIDNDNAAKLFAFRNTYCKILFSSDNISKLETELVNAHSTVAPTGKTPSQRLRAVLWKCHEQSGLQIPFDDYYATELERIIIHYKEKLNT